MTDADKPGEANKKLLVQSCEYFEAKDDFKKGKTMKTKIWIVLGLVTLLGMGCVTTKKMEMTSESVKPGTEVTLRGTPYKLLGDPLMVGAPLPPVRLTDARTMKDIDLSAERGSVLLLSIVVSVDTAV
jgi:hypothetical protein